MTYYLKYRPKTVSELDLTAVRDRLSVVTKSGKFSHAYLFYGPRGSGKTSAARILSREAGVAPIDVIEMDAASNRGIDDIRELRERVGLLPSTGSRKAYIIDEAHMLTTEAFNALLKTLEEPPPHVIFFLCTTEFEKLPETVVSRCVKIPFTSATIDEILRSLRRTADGEQLTVEDDVLRIIAASADGSFREAKTVLEESALASGGKEIKMGDVERVIGMSLRSAVQGYVAACVAGDAGTAVSWIGKVMDQGGNIEHFSRQVLQSLRDMLLVSARATAKEDAARRRRLLSVTDALERRIRTVKYSPLAQLPLEIAALELSLADEGGPERRETIRVPDPEPADPPKKHSRGLYRVEEFRAQWPQILQKVREKNHGIVTLLSHCRPADVQEDQVVLDVKYKFHKEQLEQDRFRQVIEAVVGQVTGRELRLMYHLDPQTQSTLKLRPADDNIQVAVDDELTSAVQEIFSI